MLALFAGTGSGQDALPSLGARPVELCEAQPECEPPGQLRLLGVLELASPVINGLRFSQLSALAWDDQEAVLYALSDKGLLFALRPVFRNGRLQDVSLHGAAPLLDPKTGKPVKYRRSDSEGLDIFNGRASRRGGAELLVSFEGEPRLARHRPDGSVVAEIPLSAPLNEIRRYRYNRMLESVCIHPREGILTAPEEPLDTDPEIHRLYRTDGQAWRLPPLRGGIVALECLPDGDVLLLERAFSPLTLHTVISLRRVRLPAGTVSDTVLNAATVAVFDSRDGWMLDNFEGLARHRGNRFFMISDNNDLFVQRTLLVYFELLP